MIEEQQERSIKSLLQSMTETKRRIHHQLPPERHPGPPFSWEPPCSRRHESLGNWEDFYVVCPPIREASHPGLQLARLYTLQKPKIPYMSSVCMSISKFRLSAGTHYLMLHKVHTRRGIAQTPERGGVTTMTQLRTVSIVRMALLTSRLFRGSGQTPPAPYSCPGAPRVHCPSEAVPS